MTKIFTHTFDTPVFKGTVEVPLGNFIDGKFVDGSEGKTIDVINPSTGKKLTEVAEGTSADVDAAVVAARKAFETVWGLKTTGAERGRLLFKLAEKWEEHADRLAAVEALDNGKAWKYARAGDVGASIDTVRYYAGWADKNHGKVIEVHEGKLAYTRHEPIGVAGQIIPWNFPLMMLAWKIGPALATGCTIVLKPSEFTPLSALYAIKLIHEVGFPPGVVNVVNGYGSTVGAAISAHPDIDKVAFTGSTIVGRRIMESAARSNLKNVTLELGGKSPNIIFADADLDLAVGWAAHGIFYNQGQVCCAGSRIFVQESIHDKFLEAFTEKAKSLQVTDPFDSDTYNGPQVSQTQFDRIMEYIDHGKQSGASVHLGGTRVGNEGYFISPTIFTNTKPDMKIVKEEIFGPVGVLIPFKDEEDVIRMANDTTYGLASAIFSTNVDKCIRVAHSLNAGTAWVNCTNILEVSVPFGGYKQSGIGRELGEYALANYTSVKAIHVNLGGRAPNA